MKNRAWFTIPFILVFSVVMMVFACISLAFSKTLFFIEGIIAFVGIIASLIIYLSFNSYVRNTVKCAVNATRSADEKYLE
ncbi:MAG: hypothetical protein II225_04300 [Ruminococcus sp.]|nr:hypothetical protein [Ruminococcus sp.]